MGMWQDFSTIGNFTAARMWMEFGPMPAFLTVLSSFVTLSFFLFRCYDSNLMDMAVEIETPDHNYYHVCNFVRDDFVMFEREF